MANETFNAASATFNSRIDLVSNILANMKTQTNNTGKLGVLLTGDPGIGKTSFVQFLAKFMGMTLITIEAPHITEEHVINIPFIVSTRGREKTGEQEVEVNGTAMNDYELVLADSHLFGEITHAQLISEEELLHSIYNVENEDTQRIWEKFGGSESVIPSLVLKSRQRFKVILFIDEFFRQSSMRIKNMLRGVLDGKIGSHDIPHNVYVMYASNMNNSSGQEGIEPQAMNQDFEALAFPTPDKDDWFAWLIAKFKKENSGVTLDMRIINKFHELLNQEDLSHLDAADIRVSPRRWEQVLLYINASLPAETAAAGKSLLTNIKASFKNYQTGEHAEVTTKVLKAVSELIDETSEGKISVSASSSDAKSGWRETLSQQIAIKKKLGNNRSYVPIISGQPGVGKTTHASNIAAENDLRYIYINCSVFDQDDINGIPTANKKKDGGLEIKFSLPKLYRQIKKDMDKQDAIYKAELRHEGKEKEADDYDKRQWKYLVFFDELNRTSTKVFNSLRRVILEKKFGDDLKLPDSSIVIAAINPSDLGTTPLTSHMRDVVDVLDTAPSWKGFQSFATNDIAPKLLQDVDIIELVPMVKSVIYLFANKFKNIEDSQKDADEQQFYIDVGADTLYVSPREYTQMYASCVNLADVKLSFLMPKFTNAESEDERKELSKEINYALRESVYQGIIKILNNVESKHKTENPKFKHDLHNWIMSISELDLQVKEVKAGLTFEDIMDNYYGKELSSTDDLSNEQEFVNYLDDLDLSTYTADVRAFLLKHIKDDEALMQNLATETHPKKTIVGTETKIEDALVSKVEHFIREIIHALIKLNMSNEFVAATKTGVRTFLEDSVKIATNKKMLFIFNAKIVKYLLTIKSK